MSVVSKRVQCILPSGAKRTRFGEKPHYEEGLYEIAERTYAWLVPNGSWGESNSGLVVGENESLLIDTLWDVPLTRAMLDAMAHLVAEAPVKTLVNTHSDGDHFYGNQLLADALIITSEASAGQMLHHPPKTMLQFERLGKLLSLLPFQNTRNAGHWFQAMCAPYDFASVELTPANRTFSGTEELSCGGREVRLIEVGPAHTAGDLMVHLPDAKTLFAGDILFIGSTPVIWAGPLQNWLKALDLILDMDVDVIVPGHGPIIGKAPIAQLRKYWEFAAAEAERHFDAGATAYDAAHAIVSSAGFRKQAFANWDSPERMVMNCEMLYREFEGRERALTPVEIIKIMYRQAQLAHALPNASPAAMRRRV